MITLKTILYLQMNLSHILLKNLQIQKKRVRNLKRRLENIVSIINIYNLNDNEDMIMESKIKDFKLPIQLNNDHIDSLLKKNNTDVPPPTMLSLITFNDSVSLIKISSFLSHIHLSILQWVVLNHSIHIHIFHFF